jgi:hypothetical protein
MHTIYSLFQGLTLNSPKFPQYSMEQGLTNSLEWCLDQGLV